MEHKHCILHYGKMELTIETVTPVTAAKWLETNHSNRRLRNSNVAALTRDMLNLTFQEIPVAVCFFLDGSMSELANGQHRLSAIVKSGMRQDLLIARNCTREQINAMDIGVKRSITDLVNMLGLDYSKREASIARIIVYGPTDTSIRTISELTDALIQHEEAITFVTAGIPHSVGLNAPVLAVCARAWYSQDRERIHAFINVIKTGLNSGKGEQAAIVLRNWLLAHTHIRSRDAIILSYARTQTALQHFIDGHPITRIYGTDVELFPVPKDSVTRINRAQLTFT